MTAIDKIYRQMQNPLTNEMVEKLLKVYSEIDLNRDNDFYRKMMKKTEDGSKINIDQRNEFYVKIFNDWKHQIAELTDEQIKSKHFQKHYSNIEELRDIFRRNKDFTSFDQLDNFLNSSSQAAIVVRKNNPLNIQPGRDTFQSWKINDVGNKKFSQIKHRIYINAQKSDIHEMCNLLYEKFKDNNVPFYFKIHNAPSNHSATDEIVLYSENEQLESYLKILEEIEKQQPKLVERFSNPPLATGKINKWCGYASEPTKVYDSNGDLIKESYNSKMSKIFQENIQSGLEGWLKKNSQMTVKYKGQQITLEKYLNNYAGENPLQKLSANITKLDPSITETIRKSIENSISKTTLDSKNICVDKNVMSSLAEHILNNRKKEEDCWSEFPEAGQQFSSEDNNEQKSFDQTTKNLGIKEFMQKAAEKAKQDAMGDTKMNKGIEEFLQKVSEQEKAKQDTKSDTKMNSEIERWKLKMMGKDVKEDDDTTGDKTKPPKGGANGCGMELGEPKKTLEDAKDDFYRCGILPKNKEMYNRLIYHLESIKKEKQKSQERGMEM